MTGVEHVAFFFNDLYDMETVRGFDDLGNVAGFEGHGRIGENRPVHGFGSHA